MVGESIEDGKDSFEVALKISHRKVGSLAHGHMVL
jgi:hypothetical protein